jgi:polyphosphate kinase
LPAHPVRSGNYHRPSRALSTYVDDYVATLLAFKE